MTPSTMSTNLLQLITKAIFEENSNKSDYALASDVGVQGHFATSYKTRYLLELLQNARDAIVNGAVYSGKVKAWVDDNTLYFANNGKDFDEKGVNAICYPAISDKNSREFIGHKGIGFNAILEITDSPEIITQYGSFYFDAVEAGKMLDKDPEKLALFRYPLYRERTVADFDSALSREGYTTVFKFPLKSEFQQQKDVLNLHQLSVIDLIFLSAIHELQIADDKLTINVLSSPMTAIQNDRSPRYFKSYDTSFEFDENTIITFDKHEQEQFKDSKLVECRFLLELDKNAAFIPAESSRLHLFYALDFSTGFTFAIHSYFSVSIERKNLAESKLNTELFKRMAVYYVNEFLKQVKLDFFGNELAVLAYRRTDNNRMDVFYDELKRLWRDTEFIYHEPSRKYLKPKYVILVSENEYNAFVDGTLGAFALLNPGDMVTNWLIAECGVQKLHDSHITNNIESKCRQYQQDPIFFERLYKIIIQRKLNVKHKAVLLTQNLALVSANEVDVYYLKKVRLEAPVALEAELSFINKDIEIDNVPDEGTKYLGVKEYNGPNVIKATIEVLDKQVGDTEVSLQIVKEILQFLNQFDDIDQDSLNEIYEATLLPVYHLVTRNKSWVQPLFTPVYFDDFDLQEHYDYDIFCLDFEALGADSNIEKWANFLNDIGVWHIPAIIIVPGKTELDFQGTLIEITNNRALHMPKRITEAFSKTIFENWLYFYKEFINDDRFSFKMLGNEKSLSPVIKLQCSSFLNDLRSQEWIPAKYKGALGFFKSEEVLGLNVDDARKSYNNVISNYIPVFSIDLGPYEMFINDFSIKHCNNMDSDNFDQILDYVAETFTDLCSVIDKKNFETFYNRILSFVYEYLTESKNNNYVETLKERTFLTRSIHTKVFAWTLGQSCIHVDEKSFLDRLVQHGVLDGIPNPFSFTKRDKNEWGRYAARIGRPISKIVVPQVTSKGYSTSFIGRFDGFEIILAFVENDLDKNFTDEQILFFKEEVFNLHDRLLISYAVEGKSMISAEPYYVSGEKDKTLLDLEQRELISARIQSLALLDYFEHYTGKELKRLDLVFESLLSPNTSAKSRLKYALNHDLDQARIESIMALLNGGYYEEQETIIPAPVIINAKSGNKPQYIEQVTQVTEIKEVKEIVSNNSIQDFLDHMDSQVGVPSHILSQQPVGRLRVLADVIGSKTIFSAGLRQIQTELSDTYRRQVGFFAEYYIYQKILTKEPSFMICLGFDSVEMDSITWFNKHRIKDFDATDGSTGKGHDFYSQDLDVAIEVKGMVDYSPYLTITGPEMLSMRIRGESYFLVLVKHVLYGEIQTIVIQNPYAKILSGELNFIEAKINTPN